VINILDLEPRSRLDAHQVEISKALLANADMRDECLQVWLQATDFDKMQFSEFKLIPLLCQQFMKSKIHNPHHGQMQGIYRHLAIKANLRFKEVFCVLQQLTDENIDFIAFKGLAMVFRYYQQPGLRWMNDIDLLVDKSQLSLALNVVEQKSWTFKYTDEEIAQLYCPHSFDYVKGENALGIDVHQYCLRENPVERVDARIRSRATVCEWRGIKMKVMSPEDLIVTAVVNGMRDVTFMNNIRQDITWICDVLKIMNIEEHIDWNIVFDEVRERCVEDTFYFGMRWLYAQTNDKRFQQVISQIERIFAARFHQLTLRVYMSKPSRLKRKLVRMAFSFWRLAKGSVKFPRKVEV